jgi:ferredoxin
MGDSSSRPEVRDDWLLLESRGWTIRADDAQPKRFALASLVNLAPPDPVASVSYVSHGNLLVIAPEGEARARDCAASLAGSLHVTLLQTNAGAPLAGVTSWTGRVEALGGYLGEFVATLADLRAPGQSAPPSAQAKFDLVLDFSPQPLFAMHQPPQGYYRAPATALEPILDELREAVGEFEKPRYFNYRENICAHGRSSITGCNACVEVCSASAIQPDGDHVRVDPHLCVGCGACSTVCPSGAMSYQFPRVADRGAQLKQLLAAYRHAGGRDAAFLFHSGAEGRELLASGAAAGHGLPGRVIPLETWHVASIGLDLLLPAIAFGASQVAILCTGAEAPAYTRALKEQMAIGQSILTALGYAGTHFTLVEAADAAAASAALEGLQPATGVAVPALFMLANDKRTAIEFAVEHLAKHAPVPCDEIALPAGAPYGEVVVDVAKCTLCLACAGACPESALMDGADQPMLKFLERNCVQCGLCEKTCPEDAITLKPRLLLTPAVREARVLNETKPFHCVLCAKPFGTQQMVHTMLGRLAGHSMFSSPEAQRRLQMCADCRVVDMMANKNEASVLKL